MSARTLTLLPIVAVAVFLGLLVLIVAGGGDDGGSSASSGIEDPLAEALAFIPADAPLVAVLETDTAAGPLAALTGVGARVPGSTLALGEVGKLFGGIDVQSELLPVLGNPVVLGASELPREGATRAPGGLPFRVPSLDRLASRLRVATVSRDPDGLDDLFDRLADSAAFERDGDSRGFDIYVRPGGGAFGIKDGILVGAGSRTDLGRALTLHSRATVGGGATAGDGTGALTTASVRERFSGLPGRSASALRAAVDVEELEDTDVSDLEVPWITSVRRAAFAVVPDEQAVSVRFRFSTDPETVTDGDVPIATGPAAPSPAADEDEPVVIAFRDVAHTIEFVRRTLRVTDPTLARELDAIEVNLRRFARVDPTSQLLLKLTGTTTVTTGEDGAVNVRAEVNDPLSIADVLRRLSGISTSSVLEGGIGKDGETRGITFESDGTDTYRIVVDGAPAVRIGVLGEAVVLSTDESADLQTLADAFGDSPDEGVRGAFSARVSAEALAEELERRFGLNDAASVLGPIGGVTVQARGETEALSGTVRFAVGDE